MIKLTHSNIRILLIASAGVGALTLRGGSALAQETESATTTTKLNEIVVTANKREERLSDVGMAVTAIGGATATIRQQLDLQDLATSVPDLSLQQGGVANSTKAVIRGENSGSDGATVATVMDDIPISFSASNEDGAFLATDPDTYDLNRIEVLKGPQGTLYGAVAEGGIIKYVTNAPDPSAFHSGFEVGGLSIEHGGEDGSAKGYANIPLLDEKAALRITGFYEGIPGWEDNGMLNKKDVNGGEKYGGRISLLVQATPDLTIRATAHIQYLNTDGEDKIDVQGANSPNDPFALVHGYNYYTFSPDRERSSMTIYGLNVTYNLHMAQLQSITSYGTLGLNFLEDQPYLFALFGPNTSTQQRQFDGLKKFNQEVRFSSEPGSELFGRSIEWQTGIFYTNEQNRENQ